MRGELGEPLQDILLDLGELLQQRIDGSLFLGCPNQGVGVSTCNGDGFVVRERVVGAWGGAGVAHA
jgi:hypothetical protein